MEISVSVKKKFGGGYQRNYSGEQRNYSGEQRNYSGERRKFGFNNNREEREHGFNRDREEREKNEDVPKERKRLNLAPRTKPLEPRHINPGQDNQEEPKDPKKKKNEKEETQIQEVKQEEEKEEKEENPKSKENPFGNATPVTTTYKEREQQFVEKKPRETDNNTKRDQGRNYQKNNRNQPWPKQKRESDRDLDEERVYRDGGSWSFRGGRKNNNKRGGQRPNNSYNLRKDETLQQSVSQPVSNNIYDVLFDGNVEDNEKNEEPNDSKE